MSKTLPPQQIPPLSARTAAAVFFVVMMAGGYLVPRYEAVGSIAMLVVGTASVVFLARAHVVDGEKISLKFIACGVFFFALFGCWIDAPGNFVYNALLEQLFCPADTELTRALVRHRKTFYQEFRCVNGDGQDAATVSMFALIAARFGEYILIGCALTALAALGARLVRRTEIQAADAHINWKTPLKPRKKHW